MSKTNIVGMKKTREEISCHIYEYCYHLKKYVLTGIENKDLRFSSLCISLARTISHAIAIKEIPEKTDELASVLKLVYDFKNDAYSHAAILILLISIKNACKNKWFSDKESEDLLSRANEILSSFSKTMNLITEPSGHLSSIMTIMSRYYPKLMMGKILAFLEVKPGYETCIHDFIIATDTKILPEEKASFIVAQCDNTETSSCLITPSQANFLINGIGVDGRNNVSMDTGPQMPTQIHDLLNFGVNILQVIGQFNGNYIVVVALMSTVPTPEHSELQDYVRSTVDLGSEHTEGASRISLNCPISSKRIKIPVKGHMCKHSECFDYESYMDINSKRPSWHCPYCNQHVCFTDIRIDQNMAKVIKELGSTVKDGMGSMRHTPNLDESGPGPASQHYSMTQNIDLHAQSQIFGQWTTLPTRVHVGPPPGFTSNGTQQAKTMGVGPEEWRPSGHMRGSLSGQIYTDAYNQYAVQQTQKGQTRPPVSNVTIKPLETPSQKMIRLANETALAQIGNISYRGLKSASTVSGSCVFREPSSENK